MVVIAKFHHPLRKRYMLFMFLAQLLAEFCDNVKIKPRSQREIFHEKPVVFVLQIKAEATIEAVINFFGGG